VTDYSPERLDVAAILRDEGKAVTLRVPGASSTDPVTGNVTPGTPTSYACHALEEDQNAMTVWTAGAQPGSIVQGGDRFFMLAALDDSGAVLPAPSIDSALVVAGAQLAIKGSRPFQPGDIAIFYKILARG